MSWDPGSLICNRYWLLHRLGKGALGELWCAADRVPDRRVALRRLNGPATAHAQALADALDEAKRARAVRSASLEQTLDVGVSRGDTRETRETAWLATELLHGEKLDVVLARRGRLLPGAALELVAALAEALAAVHAQGLLHLGVAPERVLLHRGPDARITPKLLELGVAPLRVTDTHAPCESPELTSEPSAASDVWSLGVVLFRACTGAWPGRSAPTQRGGWLPGRIDGLASLADVDSQVRRVLEGCLALRPADRLTAAALAAEARFAARRARGGFVDLARMVRVPERSSSGTGERLRITHFPTLPSLGGGPPPRHSLAAPVLDVRTEPALDEALRLRARTLFVPSEPPPAPTPSPTPSPTPTPQEPTSDVTLALVASVREEIGSLPELRPRSPRRRALFGIVAAALTIVAVRSVAVHGRDDARRATRSAAAGEPNAERAAPADRADPAAHTEVAKSVERVERVEPATQVPPPIVEPSPPTGATAAPRAAPQANDTPNAPNAPASAPTSAPIALASPRNARPAATSTSNDTPAPAPASTEPTTPRAPIAIGNLTGVPLLDAKRAVAPPPPPAGDEPYE